MSYPLSEGFAAVGAVQLKLTCELPTPVTFSPVGENPPALVALASVAGQPTIAAIKQTPSKHHSQRLKARPGISPGG
jgi:hypothetical protein